jgi:hypothetical protein
MYTQPTVDYGTARTDHRAQMMNMMMKRGRGPAPMYGPGSKPAGQAKFPLNPMGGVLGASITPVPQSLPMQGMRRTVNEGGSNRQQEVMAMLLALANSKRRGMGKRQR